MSFPSYNKPIMIGMKIKPDHLVLQTGKTNTVISREEILCWLTSSSESQQHHIFSNGIAKSTEDFAYTTGVYW